MKDDSRRDSFFRSCDPGHSQYDSLSSLQDYLIENIGLNLEVVGTETPILVSPGLLPKGWNPYAINIIYTSIQDGDEQIGSMEVFEQK